MTTRASWRRYCTPLNLAAYGTLIAVALALSQRPPAPLFGVALQPSMFWMSLLALFLAGFLLATVWTERSVSGVLVGLLAMVAATLALTWGDTTNIVAALLVITASVATTRLPPFVVAAFLAAANLAIWWILSRRMPAVDALLIVAIYGGFQAFAAFASHAFRRANETAALLQETNSHLLATRSLLAESARDGERLRLSRELHDVAGHKLTALKLNLALLDQDSTLGQRAEFRTVRTMANELLDDLRGVVAQLRRYEGIDLAGALTNIAAAIPKPRIVVEVDPNSRLADAARADDVLRIAQEAITNAVRHSSAQSVRVRWARVADSFTLTIDDDGRQPMILQKGHGIAGMYERADLLGGRLEMLTSPEGGLRVQLTIPAQPTE
jgi:signal transduction histidine kinase